jgi:hypothetical protein
VEVDRRRGKSRTRILYWFRTPPGVKVGRAALDEDAIRLIEELNPNVEFDWTRILKGGGSPPTESRPPVDVRRQRPGDQRRPPPPRPPASRSDAPPPDRARPPEETARPSTPPEQTPTSAEPRVSVVDEGTLESADMSDQAFPSTSPMEAAPSDEALTPAHAKLGSEGVQRLRARYAEICARITERVTDPARKTELSTSAERLNPDTWVTADEVSAGLEQYEMVFASLREVVGHKRRKRRRGGRHDEPGSAPAAAAESNGPESHDSPEGNEAERADTIDSDSGPEDT